MIDIKVKRKFKLNEEVQSRGHRYESAKIIEILPNDKYKIAYTTYNENSRVKRSSGETEVFWYEIIKNKKTNSNIFNKRKEKWRTGISFHNTRLMEIVRLALEGNLDLDPDYQREYVWSSKDQELLINSIFEGIEIGKFAMVHLEYKEGSNLLYEILDGKQRVTTLVLFITDQFKYKGKYFSELASEDRVYFMDYNITLGETRSELSEKEKREYFLRLNTRGVEQTSAHLEKVKKQLSKL